MTQKCTKLTRIIQGNDLREAPAKHKQRKRLSVSFYRKRSRKAWETRKRQAAAREMPQGVVSAECAASRHQRDAA